MINVSAMYVRLYCLWDQRSEYKSRQKVSWKKEKRL